MRCLRYDPGYGLGLSVAGYLDKGSAATRTALPVTCAVSSASGGFGFGQGTSAPVPASQPWLSTPQGAQLQTSGIRKHASQGAAPPLNT